MSLLVGPIFVAALAPPLTSPPSVPLAVAVLLPVILPAGGDGGPLTPSLAAIFILLPILIFVAFALLILAAPAVSASLSARFAVLHLFLLRVLFFCFLLVVIFLLLLFLGRRWSSANAFASTPPEVVEARQLLLEQLHEGLLRLGGAGEHGAALLVVLFRVGENQLHVFQEVLRVVVRALAELALHRLEVHGLGDDVQVVLRLLRGNWLPERQQRIERI